MEVADSDTPIAIFTAVCGYSDALGMALSSRLRVYRPRYTLITRSCTGSRCTGRARITRSCTGSHCGPDHHHPPNLVTSRPIHFVAAPRWPGLAICSTFAIAEQATAVRMLHLTRHNCARREAANGSCDNAQ